MNKKERAEKIRLILEKLYPAPAIPLKHNDPLYFIDRRLALCAMHRCTGQFGYSILVC